jgi:hypothetical protein
MKKISVVIVLVLSFAISAFTQTSSVSKGSIVVPQFTFKWSDLDASWRGFLKLQFLVEENNSGILTINGKENWKAVAVFPAYDGSNTGWGDSLYQSEYQTPKIVAYKVDKIDRKKDFTEVSLSKLNDRLVDLKLKFGNSIKDVNKALNEILFLGNVDDYKKSDFYQNVVKSNLEIELGKLPKELSELPKTSKISLLEEVNYNASAIWTELFKDKSYIGFLYSDDVKYNTNRVNQAERIARTIQKYLPAVKRIGKQLLTTKEIYGIELKVKIAYSNFVDKSPTEYETLQYYVPLDGLKLFIDADITDQELIDKSVVLLNDNRVKVNLSQFSN